MNQKINEEIQILINKYKFGDYNEILNKCSSLLKKNPNNDFLWNLAGLCFQRVGNHLKAITSFQNAIENNSKNISAKNNLGISYKSIREYSKAEKIFKDLILENENYINAIVNIANLKKDTYFFEDALSNYKKALQIDENLPELHLNISNILQVKNEMDLAKNHLFKALELRNDFCKADQNLSMLLNYKDSINDKHLSSMIDKLQNTKLDRDNKILLHFGLGKAFEDKKNYEESFKHFEQGNNLKKEKLSSKINFYKKKAEDIKKYFSKIKFKKNNENPDNNKIFILGLPRSGTTLLEKIISSHSKVGSVSEIGYLYDHIDKNIIIDKKINENQITKFINSNFGSEYDNFLKQFNIKKKFILDKTLTNFWYIGFIKIFFPNSKIIHSYRNPKDNCLSIFKNLFPDTTGEKWLYDQNEMGEYYLIYHDLMKFWNKLFPNQIYNSEYENLINNKDSKIKDLIKFCGLEWDEKCLNHHKNTNPIKTLSINQANKPIYKSSINSSQFYENKLLEIYEILEKLD